MADHCVCSYRCGADYTDAMKKRRTRRVLEEHTRRGDVDTVLSHRSRKRRSLKKGTVVKAEPCEIVIPCLHTNPTPQQFREGKYMHASDLIYRCTRAMALSDQLAVPFTPEIVWDGRGITFAQGVAIQEYVTNRLKANAAEKLYGSWRCLCQDKEVIATLNVAKQMPSCRKCDSRLIHYHEIVVHNDKYMIVGSVDLLLIENRALYVIECKSINKKDWEALTRPIPDHLIQVVLYWFLMREAGYSLNENASILYVVKEFKIGSPYKEFIINIPSQLHRIKDYLRDAKDLKRARRRGGLPPRITCVDMNSPAAKKCSFAIQCFALPG